MIVCPLNVNTLRTLSCSLTHKEAPVVDTFTTKNKSNMNTYNEQFYNEIVKNDKFSFGKFNDPDYPIHLSQSWVNYNGQC